ncbi:MAG TPA: sigma-54 dependent transcriptional regulator [Candidatus Binataceae bacterium]|nr:sigma-54 dependent transcriptional regulator [Candidatus Binataceae bacterium]
MNTAWSALIIDDDPGIRQSVRLCLEADNSTVLTVGTTAGALEALERGHFDVVFLDLWLQPDSGLTALPEILRCQPGIGVIVITAFASFETAVEAMRLGAVDYLPKPFTPDQVRHAARRVVNASILRRQLSELQDRLDEAEGEVTFETHNATYASFLQTASRAAVSDSVVLLRGESGTGKSVLARWIRQQSKRAEKPFVTVHCPMLSSDLMSSTLFGHKKGAFTGAIADTIGKVEAAQGGTLFLDEVGDLTPDAQARLLRFLHERRYERVGDVTERKADVRLIAATNKTLEDEVKAGRFREDLFFRLNVISLKLPALRERREDLLPLARQYLHFFERRQGRFQLVFSPRCEAAILNYLWPGNLRELRSAVERGVILSPASILEPEDLGLAAELGDEADSVPASNRSRSGSAVPGLGEDWSIAEIEREHIARVVARVSSYEEAAKILAIDPTTLQRKRKRYGLA